MNNDPQSQTGIDPGFMESVRQRRQDQAQADEFARKNVTRDGKPKTWDDVRDDPNWESAL